MHSFKTETFLYEVILTGVQMSYLAKYWGGKCREGKCRGEQMSGGGGQMSWTRIND